MKPSRICKYIFRIVSILVVLFLSSQLALGQDWKEGAGYLQLIDRLDRPQDGYCLDIIGSGKHLRFDLPLIAHNCKPGLYSDEAIILEKNGYIRFPAFDKCATVIGLNKRALPGASLMPRQCGEEIPFLNTENFQKFQINNNGLVELSGSGLCLTVGRKSDSTFSPDHRWRPLYVETCGDAESARSRWKFVTR